MPLTIDSKCIDLFTAAVKKAGEVSQRQSALDKPAKGGKAKCGPLICSWEDLPEFFSYAVPNSKKSALVYFLNMELEVLAEQISASEIFKISLMFQRELRIIKVAVEEALRDYKCDCRTVNIGD